MKLTLSPAAASAQLQAPPFDHTRPHNGEVATDIQSEHMP